MAQVSSPQLRSSGNAPVVVPFLGLLGPSTATNFGAATGVLLPTSDGLLSDIKVVLVTTAETTAISAKDWGGATIAAANLTVLNATTGRQVVASALASGTYIIPINQGAGVFQSLIFTKSAAVNTGTAIVSCAYDQQANL